MKYLLVALLMGCSPSWFATTKKCPTTTMKAADLLLVASALALSGLHWSSERYGRSAVEGALGLSLWTATTYSEVKCVR